MSRERSVAVRMRLILDDWSRTAQQASRDLDQIGQHGRTAGQETAQGMQDAGRGVQEFGNQAQNTSRRTATDLDKLSASSLKVSTDIGDMGGAFSITADAADQAANSWDSGADSVGRLSDVMSGATVDVGSLETSVIGAGDAVSELSGDLDSFGQVGDEFQTVAISAGDLEAAIGATGSTATSAGEETVSVWQRVAESARDNKREWTLLGAGVTAYGTAVTALGALVLTTGVSYNQLQQRSTAALTAMMGDTEAVADQMERLHAFADGSPFARQVWIEAQQQLIAFGWEAERVIPILSAIEEAVAATGGGNQEVLELTRIFAQMGAQGRVTGQHLMQMSIRGVDGLSMMAEAAGVTGEEMQSRISAGAISADQAVTWLTEGMQEKFGGASEAVAQTLTGAWDRVLAAFRDLSGALAEPLVSPDGGGALIDFLNNLADAMRWIEGLPRPIRDTALSLGLLTGPLALAAGGFLLMAPRAMETVDALRKLGFEIPNAETKLRSLAGYAKGGAAAFAGWIILNQVGNWLDQLGRSGADLDLVARRITGLGEAQQFLNEQTQLGSSGWHFWEDTVTGSQALDRFASSVQSAFGHEASASIERFVRRANNVMTGNVLNITAFDQFTTAAKDWDETLAQIANSGNPERAGELFSLIWDSVKDIGEISGSGFDDFLKAFPQYESSLRAVAEEMDLSTSNAILLRIALGDLEGAALASNMEKAAKGAGTFAERLAAVLDVASGGAPDIDELREGIESLSPAWREAADGAFAYMETGVLDYGQQLGQYATDHAQRLAELRAAYGTLVMETASSSAAIVDWSGAVSAATSATDDGTFSLRAYVEELERMAEAQLNFESNLDTILANFGPAFAEHIRSLDPQIAAALVDDLENGRGDLATRAYDIFMETEASARQGWSDSYHQSSAAWRAMFAAQGADAAQEIVEQIQDGTLTAVDAIRNNPDMRIQLEAMADIDPAARALLDLVEEADATQESFDFVADLSTDLADAGVKDFQDRYTDLELEALMGVDLTTAETDVETFTGTYREGMVTIEADPDIAYDKVDTLTSDIDDESGTVDILGDSTEGKKTVNDLIREINDEDGTVGIWGNPTEARQSLWETMFRINDADGTVGILGNNAPAIGAGRDAQQRINWMTGTITINGRFGNVLAVGRSAASRVSNMFASIGSRLENGGIIQRADGGLDDAGRYHERQSMMGGPIYGRTNILWGEPATGWEAYISGKPGQEARNQQIWLEAGERLHMLASGSMVTPNHVLPSYTYPTRHGVQTEQSAAGPQIVQHITANYPQAEPATRLAQRHGELTASRGRF